VILSPTMYPTKQQSQQARTPTQLMGLPPGAHGVRRTLEIMAGLIDHFKTDIIIREKALSLVARLSPKNFDGEIRALFNFVKNNIRYVRDIAGVETVSWPTKTLEYKQGDCDDKVVLLGSLLEAIGFKTRLVAIGPRAGVYTHVYIQAYHDGEWISLETTENVEAGWEPPEFVSKMII